MPSQAEATLPATRRARKSIGGRSPTRKSADRENATVDLGSAMAAASRKKSSRSKSMGPGGLDILKQGAGNRRVSLAAPSKPPPRSILKPTIPLLPEIPPHKPKQSNAPKTSTHPLDSGENDGAGAGTKVALRTEEEQQAAAREREERERAVMEKEVNDRREARRKSLANRRVSFAAEATLHTFHEIEYMQDSTTSTDSTHRASSVAAPSPASRPQEQSGPDASEPQSPPQEHVEEKVPESPADQRELHQRKRRRSSGAATSNFEDADDDNTITSTVYDSDFEHVDDVASIHGEEMTDSSEDSDEEDGSLMTVEAEEMTSASVASMASARSGFSMDSSGDLDENLRLAARMAATQRADGDEEEEVIAGFAGWGKKNPVHAEVTREVGEVNAPSPVRNSSPTAEDQGSDTEMEMEMDVDMDMTNAVGGILRSNTSPDQDQEMDMDMDTSMDVTKALGGIIQKPAAQTRRKSIRTRFQPETSEDVTSFGEQTMEFTAAIGAIQHGRVSDGSQFDTDGNEDMSMELTTAIGGLLPGSIFQSSAQEGRRRTIAAQNEADLLEPATQIRKVTEAEAEEEVGVDETFGMDMTMAVGGIIKAAAPTPEARSAAKKIMAQEADAPDHSVTASTEINSSPKRRASLVVGENGSPERAPFQGKGLRRSPPCATLPGARSVADASSSPIRTPSPRRSPMRSTPSPLKTPPAMIGSRSNSPRRQSSGKAKTTPHSPSKSRLFHQDPNTGLNTPRVVLTPQGRRLSGLGVDRSGLGSPRVTEIFDRRTSLGDAATSFISSHANNTRRAVAFADPRAMEAEIDMDRLDEEEKEDGRKILQREAEGPQDEGDATLNLREMIQGLSPKKPVLRGRKSLHVGSAKGLLGKRPAELDDDDDSENQDGVKRLKGHQGSPVKNVRLQSPPSKAETTTGRKTRAGLRSTAPADANTITPTYAGSPSRATTPRSQGRFRNVDDEPTNTVDFGHTAHVPEAEGDEEDDGERIHLQDFLNMTSIRFMELNTTKRRHTIAPSAPRDSNASSDGKEDVSLESCVVAGACTVPMLELYQHSCHELKKYISEGRRIVREIETETFEENPPLFREYMSATPEVRVLMDNQFKNVKTHARLLSKAMWYEWRMKLQDGLREGLLKISEGMDNDERLLAKQQELLSSVLPDMVKRFEALEREHEDLEAAARELADCDPDELEAARADLISAEKSIAEKTKRIEELRRDLEESEKGIDTLTKQKQQCVEEIKEADKIREECRGWSSTEISKLKGKYTAGDTPRL
ncbi:hypothetical protein B0T24DRAFT_641337 [Lasiosphaeria ovina]|uniref:Spc7 kinetochore protein domain-containing protein n=1 Tax=Lasiosphaeria ovina TaxID=92902 RepID=A0AAE0JUU6_9PEZI|nr:hypothetical protein B0T24DRAFT_641337 [Lasiosphaeria ovina]